MNVVGGQNRPINRLQGLNMPSYVPMPSSRELAIITEPQHAGSEMSRIIDVKAKG